MVACVRPLSHLLSLTMSLTMPLLACEPALDLEFSGLVLF